MIHPLSRRQFVATGVAASAAATIPHWVSAATFSRSQHVEIQAWAKSGVVRPEFYGHIAERRSGPGGPTVS